jgi:ketosteroid isomerase-like protein
MKTLTLLTCSLAAFAASPKSGIEDSVKAAEAKLTEAMVKADTKALEKLLSDDLMYTHSDTRLESKADVIQGLSEGKTKLSGIDLSNSKYRQYGDTVVATHNAVVHNALTKQDLNLYLTYVWVKGPGGWMLANRQSTRMPAK